MRAVLVYTAGRFAVLAVLAALLWLLGLDGLPLLMVAVLVSLPVSYVLLERPRARLSDEVERRVADRRTRRETFRARLRNAGGPPREDGDTDGTTQ